MKIKLIIKAGDAKLEEKLAEAFLHAKKHEADILEISYGTHEGETKRRLLNFLMKKEYREIYSRLVKSKEGWGRIFVYFRWK